mmetsp:Transcript_12808/g.34949  ORF Transcript_12808/g.34949 Transcript_12808/m.34949 type:complete len:229 (+) Transcript_12808:100-786(+)
MGRNYAWAAGTLCFLALANASLVEPGAGRCGETTGSEEGMDEDAVCALQQGALKQPPPAPPPPLAPLPPAPPPDAAATIAGTATAVTGEDDAAGEPSDEALPCACCEPAGFGRTRTWSVGQIRSLKSSTAVCTTMFARQKWNSSNTTGQNSCKPVSTLCRRKSCVEMLLNSVESTSGCSPKRSAPPCCVRSANMRSTSIVSGISVSASSRPISILNCPTSSSSTSSSQ